MVRTYSSWSRVAVASALLLFACGGDGPTRLTPAELTFAQEDYTGKKVETEGIVRRFGAEEGATRLHVVIEDDTQNRIELEGEDAGRFEGRTVVVVGRFTFEEGGGRRIEVEDIRER